MNDYDFDQLATDRPHAGVARPYVKQDPIPPAAKPKQRTLSPHHADPEYWILAAMYRPMDVATIGKLTGFDMSWVEAYLRKMKDKGRVVERAGGLWGKVA